MSVRKSYSPDFKTKIVLEILREEKTLAQLSSEYGVHLVISSFCCYAKLSTKSCYGKNN